MHTHPMPDAHKGRPYYGRGIGAFETLSHILDMWMVCRVIEADPLTLSQCPVHSRGRCWSASGVGRALLDRSHRLL